MPPADVDIDEKLVLALVADQHPDLGDRPLRSFAFGWDSALYRLGEELIVRLPRRKMAADRVGHELRWLPSLAPRLPIAVPAPVRAGAPGRGYPYQWTIVPWFEGDPADRVPFDEDVAAVELGRFVRAMAQPAPPDAPDNPVRGIPLSDRDDRTRGFIAELPHPEQELAAALWEEVLQVPDYQGPRRWLHGDLHPANILVHDRRVSAVIDFTDLAAGDPASDLACGWMTLDAAHHAAFRDASELGLDDNAWARARGWALSIASAVLATSADHAVMHAMGATMLRRALGPSRL